MITYTMDRTSLNNRLAKNEGWEGRRPFTSILLSLALLMVLAGCQGTAPTAVNVPGMAEASRPPEALTIREGDVLKISFPAAPNLDTTQQVRRDGRITLNVVGEVRAAGLAPADFEKELGRLYSSELVSNEVSVTVVSSSFSVFVSGAVIRPGKIVSDRPITALEAIMEAGGFNPAKANMKAVSVIRQTDGSTANFVLNLQLVLDGQQTAPFYLKPSDIVIVPERFTWF
jgi:polysaccharide biosynthesis/export protein